MWHFFYRCSGRALPQVVGGTVDAPLRAVDAKALREFLLQPGQHLVGEPGGLVAVGGEGLAEHRGELVDREVGLGLAQAE